MAYSRSTKNLSVSPGVSDLGYGDMLKQQVDDADEERKKKLLQSRAGSNPLGPATLSLFSGAFNA